jgi:hypothetical protein
VYKPARGSLDGFGTGVGVTGPIVAGGGGGDAGGGWGVVGARGVPPSHADASTTQS